MSFSTGCGWRRSGRGRSRGAGNRFDFPDTSIARACEAKSASRCAARFVASNAFLRLGTQCSHQIIQTDPRDIELFADIGNLRLLRLRFRDFAGDDRSVVNCRSRGDTPCVDRPWRILLDSVPNIGYSNRQNPRCGQQRAEFPPCSGATQHGRLFAVSTIWPVRFSFPPLGDLAVFRFVILITPASTFDSISFAEARKVP